MRILLKRKYLWECSSFVLPKVYHTSDHDIDPSLIDPDAIYVIKKLNDAGYPAYLVGGSVRDLLLKQTPKDYDISTSAMPEQIKQVFSRQCILIGKRFRLAHVRFGQKVIEVSTFRSGDNESDLIVQDNQWGTPEEDVLRRDFTINGLYYDPTDHSIIDYVGGWEDIHKGILKTIGEPSIRFRQDPVRMIRLLKFHARLKFEIDHTTLKELLFCRQELIKSSPARILEEIFRMLESGHASSFFRLMVESSLLELLFPSLTYFLEGKLGEEVYNYLNIADEINLKRGRNPIDRGILVSCLAFPLLENEINLHIMKHNNKPHISQIIDMVSSLIQVLFISSFPHFPRRILTAAHFILTTQYRLTPFSGKKPYKTKLLNNKEFGFALQFLRFRALKDKSYFHLYESWNHLYRQKES